MEVHTIYPKLAFLLTQDEFLTQSYVHSSTWLRLWGVVHGGEQTNLSIQKHFILFYRFLQVSLLGPAEL